ncbi:hypothetical protein [Longimicrobium sp.]|uniref:hypothetical protein n=1 Tax=Longimicrobium sp. TaxID=2029185 RepID=UPI002B6299FC|nr:hypothetical protein [Longimicrobium sp.]HSU13845.1 hypothetical protein [Longimicrobium sp.]
MPTPVDDVTLELKTFREQINHLARNKKTYVPLDHNACIVVVDYHNTHLQPDVYYATSANSAFTRNQQAVLEVAPVVPEPTWISQTDVNHRNHTEPKLFYNLIFDNLQMVSGAAVITLATERDCCSSCLKNTLVQVKAVFKKLRPDVTFRVVEYAAQDNNGAAQWKTPSVSFFTPGASN